jgi:large subunit ribosomal protein L35
MFADSRGEVKRRRRGGWARRRRAKTGMDGRAGVWYLPPSNAPAGRGEEPMPKKKTKKGATKRLKLTARGKVRYSRAGKSHLNINKSRKRKRNLRGMGMLSPSFQKNASNMLAS